MPKVIVYDSSTANAVSSTYILYEQLPGRSLHSIWGGLNAAQRESAAREVAGLLKGLAGLRNKCPGAVSVRNTVFDFKRDVVRVDEMSLLSEPTVGGDGDVPALAGPMSTKELLLDLARHQRSNVGKVGAVPGCDGVWMRVEGMIHSLHEKGVVKGSDPFSLHHPDLSADNVLLSVINSHTVKLTGVLSWENALFAPKFLGMQVPQFLQTGCQGNDSKGSVGVLTAFEEEMGKKWCRVAYQPEMGLARKLWELLVNGMNSSSHVFAAEEVLDKFEKMGVRG